MKYWLAALLLLIAMMGEPSTMTLLNLQQLTGLSEVIVIGVVGASSYSWANNQAEMWTTTPVQVSNYVKWNGGAKPAKLQLRHPGGKRLGPQGKTWSMVVAGVP